MTVRPILFQGDMVRAILDGRKVQTRRIIKGPWRDRPIPEFLGAGGRDGPDWHDPLCWGWLLDDGCMVLTFDRTYANQPAWFGPPPRTWLGCGSAPQIGDLLWVREAWAHVDDIAEPSYSQMLDKVLHRADPAIEDHHDHHVKRWRPSIHMPRWASRLTLEVTAVRVQRVQAITEADARAEGVTPEEATHVTAAGLTAPVDHEATHRGRFAHLWNRINAKRGYGWDANPWVVALTFKLHRCNVDRIPATAQTAP